MKNTLNCRTTILILITSMLVFSCKSLAVLPTKEPVKNAEIKILAKEIKVLLGVGGSFKNESIIIQGDYRNRIMDFLKEKGFKTKRVGG